MTKQIEAMKQAQPVTKKIAECLAVLRPLVKGKWPHEQALEELASYTTPPQRKPLTDEEIRKAFFDSDEGQETQEYIIAFARAIEAKIK